MPTVNFEEIYQATQDFKEQLPFLIQTVVALNAQTVLELGTDVGDSTRIFSRALTLTGGRLFTVDLKPPKWDARLMRAYYNVHVITAESTSIGWDQPLDLVFIDDHVAGMDVYTHLLAELNKFGRWVRVGGQILVHDTLHNEFGPPIQKAMTEWTTKHELPFVNDVRQHGLGIIQITHKLEIA